MNDGVVAFRSTPRDRPRSNRTRLPYVICAACDVRTYSAALWAVTEDCPRCGAALRVQPGPAELRLVGGSQVRDERRTPDDT